MRFFVRLALILVLNGFSFVTFDSLGLASTDGSKSVSIPLTFERNDGQVSSKYRFVSRHGGVQALFSAKGVDLIVPNGNHAARLIEMRSLKPAPSATLLAEQPLPGFANYLRGQQIEKWITSVPTYNRLRYSRIYPGVDLLFHGDASGVRLEHDFVVAPGADASSIRFELRGADALGLRPNGDLAIEVGRQSLIFHRPLAYQETQAGRVPVDVAFRLDAADAVSFKVGKYDHSRLLTIDPVLDFATYLDGSTGVDRINALATDSSGNVYAVGYTTSTDFPVSNAEQPTNMGGYGDAFISKLDPTGHTLIYSTYLGGSNTDEAESVAVDGTGNVVVSGTSDSQDFPHAGKLPSANSGNFIASLDPTGEHLRYSGLLGTTSAIYDYSFPRLNCVKFDSEGNAYIAGMTHDPAFPVTPGAYGGPVAPYPADDTVFIAKIQADGSIGYAATIPETPPQQIGSNIQPLSIGSIAVDSTGEVILAGSAGDDVPTTAGSLAPSFPNSQTNARAGFVLKLNAAGSALVFSTYIPGTDVMAGVALDSLGNTYLAGVTFGTGYESPLPTSPNAFQKSLVPRALSGNGSSDAGIVLKLSDDGTTAIDATYFSGTIPQAVGGTDIHGLAVDTAGNVIIAGGTAATDLPLINPLTSVMNPDLLVSEDLFLAQLSGDLSTLQFGTFLNANDYGSEFQALAIDPTGHILLGGLTVSNMFPTTKGSLQPSAPPEPGPYTKNRWNFIASIDLSVAAPSMCFDTTSVNFGSVLVGTTAEATVNITNCGNAALTLTSVTSNYPTVTVTQNCSGIAAGGACKLQLTYTPTAAGNVQGNLTLTGNTAVSPQLIAFSGVAGYPQVNLPQSIQFDPILVGQTGSFNGIILMNQGNGAFILSGASITGDFQITYNSCNVPIAVNNFCQIGMNFSPTAAGTRTGVLTLSDNLTPSIQTITLMGTGLTSAPAPTISGIPPMLMGTPVSEALTVYGTGFLPSSTISWNGSTRTTYYEGQSQLAADLLPADLQQVGEAQVVVTTPAPGGGTSAPFTATIYGMLQNIATINEVFELHSQLIYATVSKTSSTYANSVVAIDPVKMQVVATVLTGNGPDAIAVSDDGSLLYIGLDDIFSVTQISLPSGTQNFTMQLPSVTLENFIPVQTYSNIVAAGLKVVPGQPHTWLAGLCTPIGEPCGLGVAVFDDATVRPTEEIDSQLTANSFVFSSDPTVAYSTEFNQIPPDISSYKITASGISKRATSPFLPGVGGSILRSDGKLIYDSTGQVIDPSTFAIESTYPQANNPFAQPANLGFSLDTANQRLYFAGSPYPAVLTPFFAGLVLSSVSQTMMNTIGQIAFELNGTVNSMERFGANGIAMNQGNQWLFVKTSLVQAAIPPVSASVMPGSLSFGSQPEGTPSTPQQVTLTNTGETAIAISNISITGDYTESGCGTLLAAAASCVINVTFTPTALGDRTGQLTIVDNSSGGPLTVSLDGTGTTPLQNASASVSPTNLSFTAQKQGTTSPAVQVLLYNNGSTTLVISGITATGDFAQTNSCGTLLPSLSGCSISVTFTPTGSGDRPGLITVADNATAGPQTVSLYGTGLEPLQFIPVTPCRVADTRNAEGPFGGPELAAGTSREFDIPNSSCGIPSAAVAYSLNVTVVPDASLNYLTLWPSGQPQPFVSTLNSDGRVKANAAITPAGSNGGVSVFVSDASQVILDIDGYFIPAGTSSALAFYPVTPCRVADTRQAAGPLGGPFISGGSSRSFPVQSSGCGLPADAQAYSLNVTAVPHSTLNYLTIWPTGEMQPYVSTLNSSTGAVTANAAIVPAGSGGDVSVFVYDDADVILDVNGYFAPPATGGLSLYTISPCRVLDTRPNPFNASTLVNVEGSPCAPPASVQAHVLNATVVPVGSLNYLTLWPDGASQPYVSTLNADDGAVTSNMAIVPTNYGSINAFADGATNLILDISSYFAP